MNAKIPGTSFNFKCSLGFGLADDSNPDQVLSCTTNRRVEGLDTIQECQGRVTEENSKVKTLYY